MSSWWSLEDPKCREPGSKHCRNYLTGTLSFSQLITTNLKGFFYWSANCCWLSWWRTATTNLGHRWITHSKGSDAELWSFLWSVRDQTVEQTMETPVIWGVIALIMTSLLYLWSKLMRVYCVNSYYLKTFISLFLSADIHEQTVDILVMWSTVYLATSAINSLRPSDTIWRHKSGSTLAQVMACCLTAPSHYLNQCWLIVSKVQWHPSESNFTRDTSATSPWN